MQNELFFISVSIIKCSKKCSGQFKVQWTSLTRLPLGHENVAVFNGVDRINGSKLRGNETKPWRYNGINSD